AHDRGALAGGAVGAEPLPGGVDRRAGPALPRPRVEALPAAPELIERGLAELRTREEPEVEGAPVGRVDAGEDPQRAVVERRTLLLGEVEHPPGHREGRVVG